MARARVALPQAFGKRGTLTDQLDRVRQASQTEQWEVIERVKRDSENFKGFRHHAPKTQSRQDHHLEMFTNWVLFKHGKTRENFTDERELDDFLFPRNDHSRLFEDCRQFLIYVYQVTDPRSKMTGERISYRSLVHYRESLVFWIKRKYFERQLAVPRTAEMYHYMTEAMRAVISYYPGQKPRKEMKAYLGLAELRQLFDDEMLHNRSVEYAEQHWAIWCLIRNSACRAGSLCKSNRHTSNQPIKWSNFDFSAGDESGKFNVTIHFDNINIKKPVDPETEQNQPGDDDMHVTLESPMSSNLIFSVAHRLLVIALRRGILEDITTIEELMDFRGQAIRVKQERQQDFVFFRGKPQGRGLDMTQPLSVSALDDYLKTRANNQGWVFKVMGTNAIRRRALTDLVTRIGIEASRRIAGHSPESSTLERFYLFVSPIFDQTSAMLEQEMTSTGFTDAHRKKWAPLAMGKIDDEGLKRTRGAALRTMTDRLALADPDPPSLTDSASRRQYRKRLRRYAHTALKEHEATQSKASLTKEQHNLREAELEASKFAKHVLDRALELRANSASGEEYEDWDGFEDSYDSPEDEIEAEADIEDSSGSRNVTIPAEVEMEDEAETGEQVEDLSYRDTATVLMETLLENSLNTSKTWAEVEDKTCPACQEDETVSQEQKEKEFDRAITLQRHLDSEFHTAFAKFKRAADIEAEEVGEYNCPYCKEAGIEREEYLEARGAVIQPSEFATFEELKEHIIESNEQTDGRKHDELKDLGGWYDMAFFPKTSEIDRRLNQNRARANLKAMGIEIVASKSTARGNSYADFPGVVHGEASLGIPPRFMNTTTTGPLPAATPAKFAHLVGPVAPGIQSRAIPPAFGDSTINTAGPQARTAQNPLPAGVSTSQTRSAAQSTAGPSSTRTTQPRTGDSTSAPIEIGDTADSSDDAMEE